jgi:hypothetical protein
MFNAGDKVEVIATGRPGEIDKILCEGPLGKQIPYEWQVRYTDGNAPSRFTCRDENELKSMMDEPEPGISPAEPIQG